MNIWKKFFGNMDKEVILESLDLDGFAQLLRDNKVSNIITMAGAGISTAAGIPDFRSDTGLYKTLASQYNISNPMEVFTLSCFKANPEPFYHVAGKLYNPNARPTLTHYFIRLLHEKGVLLRHYTQNVDNLERISGLPEEKLIEAHGCFQTGHCISCSTEYDFEFIKEAVLSDKVPKCTKCGSAVKPDVVLFGEGLPSRFMRSINSDFSKCDMLIVMGTSLNVQPFCSLIHKVNHSVPRLYLNLQASHSDDSGVMGFLMKFYVARFQSNSFHFDSSNNKTDVFYKGTTDNALKELASKAGWEQDLLNLQATNESAANGNCLRPLPYLTCHCVAVLHFPLSYFATEKYDGDAGVNVCCTKGNPQAHLSATTPTKGEVVTVEGSKNGSMEMYITGDCCSDRCILLIYDIFGFEIKTTRIFADLLADQTKATVIMPDYFRGKPWTAEKFNTLPKEQLLAWIDECGSWDIVCEDSKVALNYVKSKKNLSLDHLGVIGFCWGGKQAMRCCSDLYKQMLAGIQFKSCAVAHGSFLNEEDMQHLQVPIVLMPAGNDPDPLPLMATLKKLKPDLAKNSQCHVFEGQEHGFCAARADLNNADNLAA
ncbi:NAD-dependent protein deacetylase sirtuin-2, partial [Cichlidogyrus casuarinus]